MPRFLTLTIALAFGLMSAAPANAASVLLWRLDCGTFVAKHLTNGCYLVKHGGDYLLWDTGFGPEILGHPKDPDTRAWIELTMTIPEQLSQLGLVPGDIKIVGLSHTHFDHIGQAAAFPGARLLLGRGDWDALMQAPASDEGRTRLEPWTKNGAAKDLVTGDKDIFGDGTVVMIATPGHTPGHHSLLVRLQKFGPVLLTGDLYSSALQYAQNSVSPHEADPAATRASFARFRRMAKQLAAIVIIQHEPADIAKLPPFPKPAD